ncbi:Predicted O-linked N-acetylglucosamine transferase, SPINDLY family [Burkholderia sp. D7]|nr:Predicted O-linked N-acetylglucosamine transferase, SPINDLY family [Burkholderia sp. D7]
MDALKILELARERHLAGDLASARTLYEQVLECRPDDPSPMFALGIMEWQDGAFDPALAWLDRALRIAPRDARYHYVRGLVLSAMRRTNDAIGAYGSVLDIDPEHVDALNNLANCHRENGENGAAEAFYRRALVLRRDANALTNLGTLLQANGRHEEAFDHLNEAVSVAPESVVCLLNLGVAFNEQRNFARAEAVMTRALELDPQFPEAAYNLANTLHAQGRLPEAVMLYQRELALNPAHADAHNNLGNVCKELTEYESAAEAFDAAISLRPNFIAAYNNSANLLRTLGRMDEAEARLGRALAIDPGSSVTHNNLGNILKDTRRLDDGIASYRQALAVDPDNAVAHSNLVYALVFQAEDAQPVIDECKRWSARHEAPYRANTLSHNNDTTPARRLRIGYVSADFRDHCQALFLTPLLSHHDHARFEIFCYSSVRRPDNVTRRIATYADVWRDVRELDDERLAQLIREDRIDILVDLTMHMADGRPLLFARKPALAQIAWLAYPGTTGLQAIDYRLTDPWLDPVTVNTQYSERSIYLADTFWCYDPLTDSPAVNRLPALTTGHVTFGSLNNPCKLSDHTLCMWSGVMQRLGSARLMLMMSGGSAREHVMRRLESHGIETQRVRFVAFRPRADYLKTYHEIDIVLDTFPYNDHTTSLDSFWMGVPVVTRVGQTAVGRAGLSLLSNLALDELAAQNDEQFVALAVELASDLPRLSQLRQGLRQSLSESPLMDGARFAMHMEVAYQQAWREWSSVHARPSFRRDPEGRACQANARACGVTGAARL